MSTLWSGRFAGEPDADVVDTLLQLVGREPLLEPFGQADAIEVSQATQPQQEEEKETDAAPAQAASDSLPGTRLGGRRHIMERRRPRPPDFAGPRCKY